MVTIGQQMPILDMRDKSSKTIRKNDRQKKFDWLLPVSSTKLQITVSNITSKMTCGQGIPLIYGSISCEIVSNNYINKYPE